MRLGIYANFQNRAIADNVRLNLPIQKDDLSCQGISVTEGLEVRIYDREMEADGSVTFSEEEKLRGSDIDWQNVRFRRCPPSKL